jgi:hypothetical protein
VKTVLSRLLPAALLSIVAACSGGANGAVTETPVEPDPAPTETTTEETTTTTTAPEETAIALDENSPNPCVQFSLVLDGSTDTVTAVTALTERSGCKENPVHYLTATNLGHCPDGVEMYGIYGYGAGRIGGMWEAFNLQPEHNAHEMLC